MAWSQHNRNDSEYLHPFGRKQQAVFCQCHHRNPTRNVKISEQKNCSEIKKMVPLTGLEPVLNRFRWILSPLCLPFHHSGVFNPFKWRDMKLEGCSKAKESHKAPLFAGTIWMGESRRVKSRRWLPQNPCWEHKDRTQSGTPAADQKRRFAGWNYGISAGF